MAGDVEQAPPKPKRLDDMLQSGWYLFRVCLLLEISIFTQTAFMFYMMYAGAAPTLKSCGGQPGNCTDFNEDNCENPEFTYQFKSVNVEWHYECGGTTTVKQVISIQMLGVLVGSVLFGQFGEIFGRKKSLLVAMIMTAIAFAITPLTWDLISFTIVRVLGGFFVGGQIVLALVVFLENSPKSSRMWISMLLSWSPNIVIYAGVAYWAQEWRRLSYAIAVLTTPGIILLAFFVSESPRWLLQKGKIEEAKQVMYRVYKVNGKEIDEETMNGVFENEAAARKNTGGKSVYSYWDIFSSKELAIPTLILCMCINFTAINSYGILFNIEKLSGSMYANSALNGCLRYIFNIVFALMEPRFTWMGRKAIHGSCLVTVIAAVTFVIIGNVTGIPLLKTLNSYALIGAASMASQLFLVVGVTGNEILPTPVRTIGYSVIQMFNRFGVSLAPFLFLLTDIWTQLPLVIMLILATIQMLSFAFFIPETRGRPMPEHMPDHGKKENEAVELVEKDKS
ncbi:unnamed protein product, partial [Mesorhabditis belari]|uniref:Major facilitator superfamily (MFS) profile domain-containing protein n=1 Tax=Mesorhabditis belari TaxID=2138241 RepID=A0AAF3FRJ3_9BILA